MPRVVPEASVRPTTANAVPRIT